MMLGVTHEGAQRNLEDLGADPRPGQGIVIGPNSLGNMALQVLWLNAANDELSDQGIPMRRVQDCHVAANGRHIRGLVESMLAGEPFPQAFVHGLEKQDQPITTPRIAGTLTALASEEGITGSYHFALARNGSPARMYFADVFSGSGGGMGRCVNTYIGEGSLPSFAKRAYDVMPLGEEVGDTAEMYWEVLGSDARTAVMVRGVDPVTLSITGRFMAGEGWYDRID